jgi:uncharacterized protein with PQ loop repeat
VPVDVLVQSLAYFGATLGVAMVVPQIIRTVRHPALAGVSPVAWGLTALACSTWLTYGLRTATIPQVPGNVLLVSGAVAVVLLVPSAWTRRRRAVVLAALWSVVMVLAWTMPVGWVGYFALLVGLFSSWPQVYDSVAGLRAGEGESGVSLATWSIKVVSQSSWLVYALATGQVAVTIAASFALSTALALVVVESYRRSTHRAPELEPVTV